MMSKTTKAGRDPLEIAALFGAVADLTRLRIVRLMAFNDAKICVCELVDCLEEPQYAVSRHLRELRDCGLLEAERDGRWMYYSLCDDETAQRVAQLLIALPCDAFEAEQRRFEARMDLRVEGCCCIGIQNTSLSDSETTVGAQEVGV